MSELVLAIVSVTKDVVMIDYIKTKDVILVIDEVDANSATGTDGFSAISHKWCKEALAKPLQLPFQSFLAGAKSQAN